jgi:hypothetical protein
MTSRILVPAPTAAASVKEIAVELTWPLAFVVSTLLGMVLWSNFPQIMPAVAVAILALVAIDLIVTFAVHFGPSEETMRIMVIPAGELRAAIRYPWGS